MRRHIRTSAAAMVLGLGLLVAAGAASYHAAHTYTVKPGDTLWALARANGLTVAQLAMANRMGEDDLLLIGRHLTIPSNAPSAGASGRPAANPWTFCATFTSNDGTSSDGPRGVLPQLLQDSPNRLDLQPVFMHWADYYNLSLPLVEAIAWQESGWQQNVVSSAGAIGTGQIMPDTAKFIQSQIVGRSLNIHSASDNIRMSAAFLAYLADAEGNNRCATIAAYYEGPLNLSHHGVFPETQAYVASVEALIPEFE
jgi:LysM repeat protein